MAMRRLARLIEDQELKDKLTRCNFKTVKDVLSLSPLQIMSTLQLSSDECEALLDRLYESCVPKYQSAFTLSQEEEKFSLSLGSKQLDAMLHGGLHAGTVIEFAGPAGVGKTQWCLHTAVRSVLSKESGGRNTSVIYIDTETAFRPERIVEIICKRYPESEPKISECLSRIFLYQPSTISNLSQILETLEVTAVEKDAGLLIVDSIASLARKEMMTGSSQANIARVNQLASWAARLKSIAQQLNICVVVTNQVTSRFVDKEPLITGEGLEDEAETLSAGSKETTYSSHITPALGNTWTHCVNTRLILQYDGTTSRQLIIAKSPVAPFAAFAYDIGAGGIEIKENRTFYSYSGSDPGLHKIQVQRGVVL
ncbi:DNA repair protein RAD51 homolog 2-like [Penaeus japonicus]|uniref:DNA repair protein RAD51 homolog 2-like n=1 Tax=Penaeus japonicus TaxID=27405 RepID=UPI001C70D46A|nr:DNA repair protein RAD51 homolog 2-like [Penaeus japonicus]